MPQAEQPAESSTESTKLPENLSENELELVEGGSERGLLGAGASFVVGPTLGGKIKG